MENKNGVVLAASDWVSDPAYTNVDCKREGRFNTPEYVEEACVNVECTEAKMTHCGANTPGERYVVQNGEAILVACEPGLLVYLLPVLSIYSVTILLQKIIGLSGPTVFQHVLTENPEQ